MAAIPVPVHFDGHNINIITEDSPSTCKSRTKGVNYGKKNNSKNKKRNNQIQNGKYGKAQLLNKRALNPPSSTMKPSNNDILVISPLPSDDQSPSNKENIHEGNQVETKLLNGNIPNPSESALSTKQQPTQSMMEIKTTPYDVQNGNRTNINILSNGVHMSQPPHHPRQHHYQHQHQHHQLQSIDNANIGSITNVNVVHISSGAMNKRKPPRLPLAAPPRQLQQLQHGTEAANLQQMVNKQNEQLISSGLDPNEFGSHDDVGFDDGESQNNNQGKDRQNLYKTELCREWSTSGWCYYNKRCSFAHGLQELRPVFRSKKWRTKRCRNWHTTGYCPYEHRCQFLHDQSPPRRISDYATANARALVAAQQRMQPLYFHYQVDCNRDETDEEDMDDMEQSKQKNGNRSKSNTPKNSTISPSPVCGPRLKRKDYRNHISHNMRNGGPRQYQNGVKQDPKDGDMMQNKRAALRMIQQKNAQNGMNKKVVGKANNQKKKRNKPKTPRSATQSINSVAANKPMKSKKKKQKDAVITPFNPVSATYGATPQSYELAAQQLGLYNPAATQLMQSQHIAIPGLSGLPPLPTLPMNAFQGLPPSIDPSLYLSLTPSPPHSPAAGKEMLPTLQLDHKLKQRGDGQQIVPHLTAGNLDVEVPPSLTPSPPTLPANHEICLDPISQQQVQMQLAKQQQTLAQLHAKVQEVAQQQAAQHAEQQATVAALLSRGVANKSATPIAPIDGAMLESLLPTDDTVEPTKSGANIKKANDETSSIANSIANKTDPRSNMKSSTKMKNPASVPNKKETRTLPPIPPIPPPLQLQTSINSVVTGAVAAAMTPTAVPSLVAMTPTLIDQAVATTNNQIFAYPTVSTTAKPPRTTPTIAAYAQAIDVAAIPTIQTPLSALTIPQTYQQQAHAHAHAYASAHASFGPQTTAYHIQPIAHASIGQAQMYNIPTGPYGAPSHPYSHIPTLPGFNTQVGLPQFYAPSPDFQEIPPQYYTTHYPQHNQLPRHYY